MSNKTKGICAGGNYTDKPDKGYHQTSPSKRHNANNVNEEVKRIRLANYIAVYVQAHSAGVRSLPDLIYSAIGKFNNEK